jgi:hypothetical protein
VEGHTGELVGPTAVVAIELAIELAFESLAAVLNSAAVVEVGEHAWLP